MYLWGRKSVPGGARRCNSAYRERFASLFVGVRRFRSLPPDFVHVLPDPVLDFRCGYFSVGRSWEVFPVQLDERL